jgi:hypothetical protein
MLSELTELFTFDNYLWKALAVFVSAVLGLELNLYLKPLHQHFFCDGFFQERVL